MQGMMYDSGRSIATSSISVMLNGNTHTVDIVDPLISLNSWIRSQHGLTGTKFMCFEGGCGSCMVMLERPQGHFMAVNSCLVLLCSVDGCSVTTTEGIGSRQEGFHQIQSRLAEFGGSQCGYCSPGFVMSMYSALSNEPSPTQAQVEDNFDGNICRCTGYRSILDAMKSFASDADPKLLEMCGDIEDLGNTPCLLQCEKRDQPLRYLEIHGDMTSWTRPQSLDDLKTILKAQPSAQLVCGNTANGVYKRSSVPAALVDVSQIPELTTIQESSEFLMYGGSVTLSQLKESFFKVGSKKFSAVGEHLKKVASTSVRNVASWAGSLMLKHAHKEFPSDLFVLLEGAGAQISVCDAASDKTTVYSAAQLMNIDMKQKVIISMTLPRGGSIAGAEYHFQSYKVMPRSQNAHAYVNAAFEAATTTSKTFASPPVLVFGGISNSFVHAVNTEKFLNGKEINHPRTLEEALEILSDEIKPVQHDALDATTKYKHDVAVGLFYKFYLSLCDASQLGPGIESAVSPLTRPVSTGTQTYSDDPSTYPVSEKIPKLSSKLQASGEAVYISDRPIASGELFCAFVVSDVANADIDEIYDSMAALMPGFVQLIKGTDLPTNVKNTHLYPFDTSRPILAADHVDFAGQPLAIVVAETSHQATEIAKAVTVTYKNAQKPLLSIADAIAEKSFYTDTGVDFSIGDPDEAMHTAKHKVSGKIHMGQQYHFYMETQIARAETTEEGGFKLECATQAQKWVQDAISYAFNTPTSRIEVSTKRIGGAYGGKSTNSLITSCAAALAAYCTKRPVCFQADLKTCMTTFGTRTPYTLYYTLGFDDDGVISAIDCTVYANSGCSAFDGELNDPTVIPIFADSAYFCPNRKYKCYVCKTNIPSSTWCRAPSSIQFTAFADQMLEHVSSSLGKDPIVVKKANLYKVGQLDLGGDPLTYCQLTSIYDQLLEKAKVSDRQLSIATYNKSNKWKKKGLSVSPIKFKVIFGPGKYTVLVSICSGDGTVLISHGGIECGQGINTKVAQVAAYELGVPLDSIMIQRTSSNTSSNSQVTGGSITSEVNCQTVIECCKVLKSRIDPIRSKMSPGTPWKDVIAKCYEENVDLAYSYMWIPPSDASFYNSYGVTATEVELDVLTGEYLISRVDTVFDCGISLNPSVDIGQVEGAFVMGLGFWLTENIVIDKESGRMLTDGTWEYKPPSSKEIPIVWNIELLKNAPNPLGILRSKASGEPPMCMAISVLNALKRAIESSKLDRGLKDYFQMPTPGTVEALYLSSHLDPAKDFTLS